MTKRTAAEIDATAFETGEVIETMTIPGERMPWRIVAGEFVGEFSLQYEFSTKNAQWRNFTGNDDMSHIRYFQGIRNARAAMKRHYARNN